MDYCYPLRNRLRFYADFAFRQLFSVWFEVKRPKIKMFLFGLAWPLVALLRIDSLQPSPLACLFFDYSETQQGKFRTKRVLSDMCTVHPGFERRDIDYLLREIGYYLKESREVLFMDVGAHLGKYSVTVAGRYADDPTFRALAFEPAKAKYLLLNENLGLNGLEERVETRDFALLDEDKKLVELISWGTSVIAERTTPGQDATTVMTRTLDSVAEDLRFGSDNLDVVFIKLDVEGSEKRVLEGARKFTKSASVCHLLVEDFVYTAGMSNYCSRRGCGQELAEYLQGAGWEFVDKLTPYNSWWRFGST